MCSPFSSELLEHRGMCVREAELGWVFIFCTWMTPLFSCAGVSWGSVSKFVSVALILLCKGVRGVPDGPLSAWFKISAVLRFLWNPTHGALQLFWETPSFNCTKRGFNEPNSSHSSTFCTTGALFVFSEKFTLIPMIQIVFFLYLIHPKHVDEWREINIFQIRGMSDVVQLKLIWQNVSFPSILSS